MPVLPPTFHPFGAPRPIERERERGSASARGYDRAWQRLRDQVLREEPLCRRCKFEDRVTAAVDVHHVIDVRDRPDLRLVRSNLEPLCHSHHSSHTARQRGRTRE
jgi:5-methylcytosine-specific restriction protein A